MNVIRVNYLPEFDFGYDAVLLTMDGAGVKTFRDVLNEAIQHGTSRLEHEGVMHKFLIETGRSGIDLDKTCVVWHLDPAKAHEISDDLDISLRKGRAGHNYVDISTPAPTLVLSRDEYVNVTYDWVTPPSRIKARPTEHAIDSV